MQLYALQTQSDEAETWKDLVCLISMSSSQGRSNLHIIPQAKHNFDRALRLRPSETPPS